MKFIKKRLIRRYAIPVRVYQSNLISDGGTKNGEHILPDASSQPYIEVNEPVIPSSNSSDSDLVYMDSTGATINYQYEWYSISKHQVGTVIAIGMTDDEPDGTQLVIVGENVYNSLTDIHIYYLKLNSGELNNDDPNL